MNHHNKDEDLATISPAPFRTSLYPIYSKRSFTWFVPQSTTMGGAESNDAVDQLAEQLGDLFVDQKQSQTPIERLVELIESNKAKKIMVLTGAGVSVAAGTYDRIICHLVILP